MITREADYALRIVLCLADYQITGERVSAVELSDELQVPHKFLRVIIGKLVKEGILLSFRGRGGGVELARESSEISMLDVVRSIANSNCLLNSCLKDSAKCSRIKTCRIHDSLSNLQETLDSHLSKITFDNLSVPNGS